MTDDRDAHGDALFTRRRVIRMLLGQLTDPDTYPLARDQFFEFFSAVGMEDEVTAGVTEYLQQDFTPDASFDVSVNRLALIAEKLPKTLEGPGFKDAVIKIVQESRDHEEITSATLAKLAGIIGQLPRGEVDDLLDTLLNPIVRPENITAEATHIYSQSERLARAITSWVQQSTFFPIGEEPIVAASFSPHELISIFGPGRPYLVLPTLLAMKAYATIDTIDPHDYAYIFDPTSDELLTHEMQERKKFAEQFVKELRMELHGDLNLNVSPYEIIVEKFGAAIARAPDFNMNVIESLGEAFTDVFPEIGGRFH